MKREVLKHLVEESLVSGRLLGDKDELEGLQGVFAENSGMVECHVLLQKWQDLWDEWLEAVTHGANDSENMVECGSLGKDIAGVEKDSLLVFHSSKFELESIKTFMGGLDFGIFLDDIDVDTGILHELLEEFWCNACEIFLEVESCFGKSLFDGLVLWIILREIVIEEVEHLLGDILNDWEEFFVL